MNVDPLNSIQGFPGVSSSLRHVRTAGAGHKQGGQAADRNDPDELQLSDEADKVPKHQPPAADDSAAASATHDDGDFDVTV